MELKEILGEELYGKITAKLEADLSKQLTDTFTAKNLILNDPNKVIPIHRLNEEIEKNKNFKAQVDQYKTDIDNLKTANAGNEALTRQITELQKAQKDAQTKYDADVLKNRKTLALNLALMSEGVGDEKARNALVREFDLEKVELEQDGKVKGFSDMIKPYKESLAFKSMFGTVKVAGQEHQTGAPTDGEFYTKDELEALTIDQLRDKTILEKANKSYARLS